jgi:hypothetical protein
MASLLLPPNAGTLSADPIELATVEFSYENTGKPFKGNYLSLLLYGRNLARSLWEVVNSFGF